MGVIFLDESEPGLKFVEEEPYKTGPKYSFSSSIDAAANAWEWCGASATWLVTTVHFSLGKHRNPVKILVLDAKRDTKTIRFLVYFGFKFKIIKVKLWPTKWFLKITK